MNTIRPLFTAVALLLTLSSAYSQTADENTKEFEKSQAEALDWETLEELNGLNLSKSELVVIQGCRSADGQKIYGEGRMSFMRKFFELGTASVVSTRNEVDDRYSSRIIGAFYKQLDEGKTKSEALNIAQKEFLKNAKSSLEANPRNWSGIVVYGDDSPLDINAANKKYNQAYWLLFLVLIAIPFYLKRKQPGLIKDDS